MASCAEARLVSENALSRHGPSFADPISPAIDFAGDRWMNRLHPSNAPVKRTRQTHPSNAPVKRTRQTHPLNDPL
jgi:hypothetical protein